MNDMHAGTADLRFSSHSPFFQFTEKAFNYTISVIGVPERIPEREEK